MCTKRRSLLLLPDAVGGLELLCPPLVLSEDVFVAGGLCDGPPPPASRTDQGTNFQIQFNWDKTCIACDDRREELWHVPVFEYIRMWCSIILNFTVLQWTMHKGSRSYTPAQTMINPIISLFVYLMTLLAYHCRCWLTVCGLASSHSVAPL